MGLKVATRGMVPPFIVMDVLRAANERAAKGEDVFHLEVGQPGTPAPSKVLKAAKRAVDGSLVGYTDARGIPELRARIAELYQDRYGVAVDRDRVLVTTGSSGGFLLAFLGAFDPGDKVALAAPGYPAYRNILQALSIEPVSLPTGPEHRFQPTPDLLEASGQDIQGLILASPSNPTGTMLDRAAMEDLVSYCHA